MLIAVLVLALLGLWSLPVVALLLGAFIESGRPREMIGAAVQHARKPRWECTTCGAHHWVPVESQPQR